MDIPFMDLRAVNARHADALVDAATSVVQSGNYILGSEVEAFEQEFAAFSGARYCVGVSNGLDALVLALRALGIGPGDEVIVPACTFVATWIAVTRCGGTPVPAEPVAGRFNIDPAAIASAVTPRTRAIVIVHLYGIPADMAAISEVAARHGLPVVEDAAQAHGASVSGRRCGGLATVAAFSFYPTKNLGALGDGGAVTTSDPLIAEKVRVLRNYGSRAKYEYVEPGYNARLDELQAAFLRRKLQALERENFERIAIVKKYFMGLENTDYRLPEVDANSTAVWHLFVVRHTNRNAIQARLADKRVQTAIHYPLPCHLQPAYRHLSIPLGSLPLAEAVHHEVLSLPLWPGMNDDQVDYVVEACRAAT